MATKKFDPSEYIKTPEQASDYIQVMLDENGTQGFYDALGHVAKAKGIGKVATKAGLGRESLYKSLSKNGNPNFDTVMRVLKSLNIAIKFEAA